jgi:hypothetical protein
VASTASLVPAGHMPRAAGAAYCIQSAAHRHQLPPHHGMAPASLLQVPARSVHSRPPLPQHRVTPQQLLCTTAITQA